MRSNAYLCMRTATPGGGEAQHESDQVGACCATANRVKSAKRAKRERASHQGFFASHLLRKKLRSRILNMSYTICVNGPNCVLKTKSVMPLPDEPPRLRHPQSGPGTVVRCSSNIVMNRMLPILIEDIERQPEDHLYEWSAYDLRLAINPIATTHVVGLRRSTKRPTVTGSIKRIDPKRLRLHTTTDRIYQLDGPPFDRSLSKLLAFQWATDIEAISAKDSTQRISDMLSLRALQQFVVTLSSSQAEPTDLLCEILIHDLGSIRFASMPICVTPGSSTGWRQPVAELIPEMERPVVRLLGDLLPKLSDPDRCELRQGIDKHLCLSVYEGPDITEGALRERLVAERDNHTMRVEFFTEACRHRASGGALKYPNAVSMLEHAIQTALPRARPGISTCS